MFRPKRSFPVAQLDSMDSLRRRSFSVLAPLVALAAVLALLTQWGEVDPLDGAALPFIAVMMLICDIGLRRGWLRLETTLTVTYWLIAAYLLAQFHHQFSVFIPQHQMLSEGVLWLPALYMATFLLWRTRRAAQIVSALIGVTLIIAAFHLIPLWLFGKLSSRLLASVAQFLLSSTLIALIQYVASSARRQYDEMRRLAYLDVLTGLPNRRAAQNLLEQLDEQGQSYALVILDLDHFKRVNEQYGHAEGDRVLSRSARLIERQLSAPALLSRWGGEEFLMVLPGLGADEASLVAERARQRLEVQPFATVGQITATFGVAHTQPAPLPAGVGRADGVLSRADRALRQAKRAGRNQVRVAQDESVGLFVEYAETEESQAL